ncbi:hypothetical protein A7K73_02700 [Candidatus Methylacidiphilum fumarolicum]|nr:hypothetical protein A7K73_02700 [Candidatus Methylacidiphilum fumarolicum]TFE75403.1 hypothetical protein A7K72_02145 [Candidatus Methylacidiphilum fumarolicum]TFE77424.1 hypothetical protein A7D33_04845 [Candidatus Methylacidiphilum fumarolicum]
MKTHLLSFLNFSFFISLIFFHKKLCCFYLSRNNISNYNPHYLLIAMAFFLLQTEFSTKQ